MRSWLNNICTTLLAALLPCLATAQACPPNIDFENGTFSGWTCYTGTVEAIDSQNKISLSPQPGPVADRHTIYRRGPGIDLFGGFPVNCPNGSGYSVKLGNTSGGSKAEGISYEFTIPANQNTYSIVYHYAVVFQDPHHEIFQQPRLEIEVKNITDDEVIDCSSFSFYPFGSLLPGFSISPIRKDNTDVWYKDWSAVSINLNNKAGKTIRLFFKTADCTFSEHFGYAYIDVNTDCSSEFIGNAFCQGDTAISITAPFGFKHYTWFNSSFTEVLGIGQTLTIRPAALSDSILAVEMIPYEGYGCTDTAYAKMLDTLTLRSYAGPDVVVCNQNPMPLGAPPQPGLVYEWSPTTGLNNPTIANPSAAPPATTDYVLTTRSLGGGCMAKDTVRVIASAIDTAIGLLGKPAFCITSGDSAVLLSVPMASTQWFQNGVAIPGATLPKYKVPQSGQYHALLINELGCSAVTGKRDIVIDSPAQGIRYPTLYARVNIGTPLMARNFAPTVMWSPALYLSDTVGFSTVFKGNQDQAYTILLKTLGGCTTVDTQLVKVYSKIDFYVPKAFTPNSDGLNDYLKPVAAGIKTVHYFKIFNRWGELIFDLSRDPAGWNGEYKGLPQPMQTVVWMAEGTGADGNVYRKKGTAILIR